MCIHVYNIIIITIETHPSGCVHATCISSLKHFATVTVCELYFTCVMFNHMCVATRVFRFCICSSTGDKEFISVSDLVDDSLISLFLEQHDISKHLTLARAKHQQRQSQFKRRNVLRYKNCEEQKGSCKFKTPRGSSKSLESSDAFVGMFRELSPDNNDEEQVQVFVEDEGEMRPKALSQSDKVKRRRMHFRRKGQDCLSVTDNKHTPHEIVNLLSVYTRSHSEDPPPSTSLSKQKSASAGTLLESKVAIGQLLKNTLVLNTKEDLSHANHDEVRIK